MGAIMTIESYLKDECSVIHTSFTGLEDLLSHIARAPINTKAFSKDLWSESSDTSFAGTRSLKEAIDLCRGGYHEQYTQFLDMQQELRGYLPTVAFRRGMVSDVYGFMPNVGAYLQGSPKSMYRLTPQAEKKFIKVYFNCVYPGFTNPNEIRNRGVLTLVLIELLEQLGYSVDLIFFSYIMARRYGQALFTTVKLKHTGENIDPMSCYFPMAHPSYLRRILFRLIEVTPGIDSTWANNYGIAPTTEGTADFLGIDVGRDLLIGVPGDMGIAGKGLLADADAFLKAIHIQDYVLAQPHLDVIAPQRPGLGVFARGPQGK